MVAGRRQCSGASGRRAATTPATLCGRVFSEGGEAARRRRGSGDRSCGQPPGAGGEAIWPAAAPQSRKGAGAAAGRREPGPDRQRPARQAGPPRTARHPPEAGGRDAGGGGAGPVAGPSGRRKRSVAPRARSRGQCGRSPGFARRRSGDTGGSLEPSGPERWGRREQETRPVVACASEVGGSRHVRWRRVGAARHTCLVTAG
jgi:hypothetical protein